MLKPTFLSLPLNNHNFLVWSTFYFHCLHFLYTLNYSCLVQTPLWQLKLLAPNHWSSLSFFPASLITDGPSLLEMLMFPSPHPFLSLCTFFHSCAFTNPPNYMQFPNTCQERQWSLMFKAWAQDSGNITNPSCTNYQFIFSGKLWNCSVC